MDTLLKIKDKHIDMSSWQEGYNAYLHGRTKDSNPYVKSSDDYYLWFSGWLEAKLDTE